MNTLFFLAICSWPRLLLEVFLRRNMGERYFSFSTAIILVVVLAIAPAFLASIQVFVWHAQGYESSSAKVLLFFAKYTTWYAFLAGVVYFAVQRRLEIRRLPSVFDFGRFSLSTGLIHPAFNQVKLNGEPLDVRTIETIVEPGSVFLLGVGLSVLGQPLGWLLMMSSPCYAVSYAAAYHRADHIIMSQIDEMICNEEMVRTFVDGRTPDETRGVNFYGRRPADPEDRRRLAESFILDEEIVFAR